MGFFGTGLIVLAGAFSRKLAATRRGLATKQ
jgi:hypothetical protein